MRRTTLLAIFATVLALAAPLTAARAQPAEQEPLSDELFAAFGPMRAELDDMRAKGFLWTGLVPAYPADADCPVINSPFASDTRGDGSPRPRRYFVGYHGGADIPVDEATPILAMADGTVILMKEGENIGGIGLVLQHSPADTGLPVWTYTEYKHLREPPPLKPGQRVRKGEKIAVAGATGTQGRHYGESGHPHLHLSAYFSADDAYFAGRIFVPRHGQWMDALALFRGMPVDSASLAALPDDRKRTPIAYTTSDGAIHPAGAKVIWPFTCKPR